MSSAKRLRYVSDNDMSSSEEDSYDVEYTPNNSQKENSDCGGSNRKPTRKPKVFSKNALMARENRQKKKAYLMSLENDLSKVKIQNKKLSTVVDNQSFLIADLKKQVKYLKSVIANSSDLSNLIRNINKSTGMSVSTSLDKNVLLNNKCVSKHNPPFARKTIHPWDETNQYPSYPTPESISETSPTADCGFDDDFSLDLFNCDIPLDFPLNAHGEDFINAVPVDVEHDYTQKNICESEDEVGVCLHVSKHRVSLEFCSSCSENAIENWKS